MYPSRRRTRVLRASAITSILAGVALVAAVAGPAQASPTISGTASGSFLVASTGSPVSPVALPASTEPYDAVATPNSKFVYVAEYQSNQVAVVNTATGAVTQINLAGANPDAIAITPDGTKVFVVDYTNGEIEEISTATNTITHFYLAGSSSFPVAVTVSPDGSKLFVILQGAGELLALNVSTLTTFATSGTLGSAASTVIVSRDSSTAYVAGGGGGASYIEPVNATSLVVGTPVALVNGAGPQSLAISPDGSTVYIGNDGNSTIQTLSTGTMTLGTPAPATGEPSGVAVSPNGKELYVSLLSGNIAVLSTSDLTSVATITDTGDPYAVTASADGTRVYTPNLSGPSLGVFNVATLTVSGPGSIPLGTATTSFNVAINDGNTPVGDYSSDPLDVHILNSADAVVATGTGSFDPSTGTATITVPTAALPNGTFSVEAATSDLASGETVVVTADGFVVGSGLAPTGVDATFPLLLGGILVLAGLFALLLVRLIARRRATEHEARD